MIKIKVNNKTIQLAESVDGLGGSVQVMGSKHSSVARRDTLRIDFPFGRKEYDAIGWEDYMKWSVIQVIPSTEEGGEPTEIEYDKSSHCLICDIVEKQDTGNVSVYMGKPTDVELKDAEIEDILSVL